MTLFTEGADESRVWIDDVLLQRDYGAAVTLGSEEPALPSMRNIGVTVPGRHGAYDFGAYFEPREFALNCVFKRQSYTDLKAQIREINRLFVDQFGRPKTVKLRFGDEVDKYYNVRLTQGVTVDRIAERGFFTIGLTAFDPYAYAGMNAYDPEKAIEYNSDNYFDTGLMYDNPRSFQWLYSKHYSGIYNYSTYNTDFIISIEGTVNSPRVTNLETNVTLTLPNISNGIIEINSKDFTVVKNGVSSLIGTNGNFFDIPPENAGFLFEGISPNAKVSYKWLHKFL